MKFRLLDIVPLIFTGLLVLWTWIVSPHSKYGDNWAVYPALALFVAAVLWHAGLIMTQNRRTPYTIYALTHVTLLIPILLYCLMRISKDSL